MVEVAERGGILIPSCSQAARIVVPSFTFSVRPSIVTLYISKPPLRSAFTAKVREKRTVDKTGLGDAWPRPHRLPSALKLASSTSNSKSPLRAVLCLNLRTKSNSWEVPSLHGVHFPHDSCSKNSNRFSKTSSKQVPSAINIKSPAPKVAPASAQVSMAISVSSREAGIILPEAPPVCTAYRFFFHRGGSRRPLFQKAADRDAGGKFINTRIFNIAAQRKQFRARACFGAYSLIPAAAVNQNRGGRLARVSTLLTTVGLPHSPATPG